MFQGRTGLRCGVLYDGPGVSAGGEEVEEEGGGRVRGYTHGPRTEQDRPYIPVRD